MRADVLRETERHERARDARTSENRCPTKGRVSELPYADCGVKGHTVIVHKGCPAENPECTNGGDRIGCCVLA